MRELLQDVHILLERCHKAVKELDVAVMDAYGLDADLLNQPERLLDALFDLNEKAATDPNYQPKTNQINLNELLYDKN